MLKGGQVERGLTAPFPQQLFFGGKSSVAAEIWQRLGSPRQYIEPFCGSAAVLLAAPQPASLEVVNDLNGFICNFWRCVKYQSGETAHWADYVVSHLDMGARHIWLMNQRERLGAELQDPDWPGDAKVAGWWLWGICSWIGSGWCEYHKGQVPHAGNPGRGIQAIGKVPHASDAGRGDFLTSSGRVANEMLHRLAARLERVRITHGEWHRCLNHHYGGDDTSVFLDPPYRAYEGVYGQAGVADAVEAWARENGQTGIRIALCGHVGDYKLDGWTVVQWKRPGFTYGGNKTTDKEAIWYSPACLGAKQGILL